MSQKLIYVLNGPNLNLLGKRQPEVYGFKTLDDIQGDCEQLTDKLGVGLQFRQSNHEGTLVDWIQEAGALEGKVGLVINPAALTHTSVALQDVILGTEIPTIEIHLSNLFKREEFRHHSYVSPVSSGMIFGLGAKGYLLAIQAMNDILDEI
ncbi:MAG: type II 3-dehydroquinate dehydratase [Hyphomicrobiales bacterium]